MSVQYMGDVQYTGGFRSAVGDIISILGVFSTPGDIMINVREGHWKHN